jgi:glycosyltransferase involved in cell wall biosynthesis
VDVCTIIAKNYVPFARTLARSHAEHHPGSRCFVLVIDEHDGYIDADEEPFELVTVPGIGIERYDRMAALYNVLELSTAVKPSLLKHLLHERGLERVAYLDPDIRIYDPLSTIDGLLRENQLVVTPHATEPMPRDGRKPTEAEILTSGVYNLGFIGMARGEDTDLLLDWWIERLERDCVLDPERGFFVDQRWIDFAPGLVESFHVLRDPGYNVAYWNLASRELARHGDRWEVNGRPLRFFHFSGFRPERPDRLSTHQNRIQIRPGSALERICADYGRELLAAGYDEASRWPYGYAALPGGLELDSKVRAVYREATARGELDQSVFEPAGARALLDYLNGPADVGGHSGVTRYLHAVYQEHGDLKTHFPDLRGVDAVHLVAWANTDGSAGIPQQLLPSNAARPQDAGASGPRAGVNLAGYFRSVLGIGEIARGLASALEAQNVAVAPVGIVAGHADQEESDLAERGPSYATFPINLVCVNADAIQGFVSRMGPDFFAGRHTIGYWWWEVEEFPAHWHDAFEHVDEIWAGTHHVADALAAASPVPVVKVTTPVEVAPFELVSRAELRLPEGFLYLFVFDYNSVFKRKNPLGLIEAFTRAFEPGEGPSLVVKCIGHERFPEQHAELLAAAARRPDVHVIDRSLPRAEKDALIAACDCYVSLHRAEGFGITLAEAMWLGKPVIATGYSGNLDFMTAANSWLVDHVRVPIGEGAEPYPASGTWAEPDVDHAARLMREVHEDPAAARERAARGRAEIRRSHSREEAGRSMARRLVRIQERWGLRAAGLARDSRGIVDSVRVARRISRGPEPAFGKRLAGPRNALREAVLRIIKPYSAFQRNVDEELLRAIQALDNGIQALAAGQAQLRPQVQRLIAESQALPEAAAGLELAEHPVAGVVSGYTGDAEAPPAPPTAEGRDRSEVARLVAGREPVLELAGGHEALHEAGQGSFGAIVARGVVERLPSEALPGFFAIALERLDADGVLVVETPNPHAARVLKTFWADPAHTRPLFPEVALGLCRLAGFGSAFVFHPGGSGNVEADRFYEEAYALVAARDPGGLGLRGADAQEVGEAAG